MYPLLLKAPIKDYIWGGTRLIDEFGFKTDKSIAAEGWMLSCHKDGTNTVINGEYAGMGFDDVLKLWGYNDKFPVLIKLIDAKQKLSVQVHPDNAYALVNEGEYGKTEMWYVVDCVEGFYGASREWFADKSLEEIVSYFKDCLAYHEKTYGKVINAVIHFDEATPHLSLISPSILQNEDGQNRLSARDIMGGRADYRRRQDEFYEQVGKPRGMERGETHDPENIREHLSVQEYKKNTNLLEIEGLEQQAEVLRKECKKLTFKNQKLQEMNNFLADQVEQPFIQYCMFEFIKKAKVRGENGEVKHIIDGFNSYMGRNFEQLRASWEAQFEAQELGEFQENEPLEREIEYDYDLDDIERG